MADDPIDRVALVRAACVGVLDKMPATDDDMLRRAQAALVRMIDVLDEVIVHIGANSSARQSLPPQRLQ